MNTFDKAWEITFGHEKGYVLDTRDSGGETIWGVTERVARANGYRGAMRDMPIETAKAIGKAQYWDLLNLDRVAAIAPAVACEVFDTSYNMGQITAGQFLQRSLNALNRLAKDYPDVKEDGLIGPGTISALSAYFTVRGAEGLVVLQRALNGLQCAAYIDIARKAPKNETFVFGWIKNRVM